MKNEEIVDIKEYNRLRLRCDVAEAKLELLNQQLGSRIFRVIAKLLNVKRKILNRSIKDTAKKVIKGNQRLKVALVIDAEDWAFANIANQIIKNLSDDFEFRVIPLCLLSGEKDIFLVTQDCDLVHFFWRGILHAITQEVAKEQLYRMGSDLDLFLRDYVYPLNMSTAVYDHLFLDSESFEVTKDMSEISDHYYVSSNKLKGIYDKLDIKNKPNATITDGVDLEIFKPLNMERFENIENRKIVIGWVGNSKWSDTDVKGVNSILIPAIEELMVEGCQIEMYFADRNAKMIAHSKMTEYYSKIDLYICTSKTEGTPNPVLEAMACGVPVISSDVGIVRDAFGKKQSEMILEERTKECLKKKIRGFISNAEFFGEFSKENLEEIRNWDWKIKTQEFKEYFNMCIKEGKRK